MLDKVLNKVKEIIGFVKLDSTKTLINTDDKLRDCIILKRLCDINNMHY